MQVCNAYFSALDSTPSGSYFYIKSMCLFYFKTYKMPLFGGTGFVLGFFFCFSFFSYIVNFFILYSGASAVRII